MYWPGVKKQLFRFMIKSTISYPLKKWLSFSKKWYMVKSIANSAVSSYLFFFSRNFQKWGIIFIIVHLNHDWDENLKWNIWESLNSASYSTIRLSSTAYFDAIFIRFKLPSSFLYLVLIINYILILNFN